jgi:hypothetical protein
MEDCGHGNGLMNAKLLGAVASLLTVALLMSTAVCAQPDQTPASAAEVPAAKGSVPAPVDETPAPASEAEAPATTTTAEGPAPKPEAETPQLFKAEQLDQLLAPIALYPDTLLAQILMAATYPLELVKADRWLQDPRHANLRGDQLANAIEAEAWDPSVRSLVPFPRILRMMDEQLDWTEQLGNAVVAQQADVMDSIQRLRYEAADAGTLWSNAQQRVTTERQGIVIEPANPEVIYPPVYSPAGVYGPWPYPDYPPFDIFPPEPDFGLQAPLGIGFGVGFVVVRPLSRWCTFDWRQRRIQLDVDRFNALNHHMPRIETSAWQRDPTRLRLPSRDFASRAPFRVFRGSSISAATIRRVNMPSVAASVPTAARRSVAPEFATIGRAPTAVQRLPPRSFTPGGRGLQARIESRPGLASRQIMLPFMPRQLPLPIQRTNAHSTPSVLGGGVRSGGAFHR